MSGRAPQRLPLWAELLVAAFGVLFMACLVLYIGVIGIR